jgi:hypothetical protein
LRRRCSRVGGNASGGRRPAYRWKLGSGIKYNRKHPDTFWIPTRSSAWPLSRRRRQGAMVCWVRWVTKGGWWTVESAVAQSIQVRTTNSKNAARRGQYDEAWRRMGLRAATREIRRDLECAVHSYSQVREFFLRPPYRLLQRTLLAVGDMWGNTVVVSVAWVRMRNAVSAERLKRWSIPPALETCVPSQAMCWRCVGSGSPGSTMRRAEPGCEWWRQWR